MRTWKLAGAFDAGHIRGWSPDLKQELNFHQLELTGHAEQLETDYQLLREEFGLRLFRDGAWLARSNGTVGLSPTTLLRVAERLSRPQF